MASSQIGEPEPVLARERLRPCDAAVWRNIERKCAHSPRADDSDPPQVLAVAVNGPQLAVNLARANDSEEEDLSIVV
jgi:hypothetical protein